MMGLMPQGENSDLVLANADWLSSAVWMSLFTDRIAQQDDVMPNGEQDKRGWWGDTYAMRPIGSRLWLLGREKQVPETARRAEEYAQEALVWLVEDGVAKSVTVVAEWVKRGQLLLNSEILKHDGSRHRYQHIWSEHAVATT